MNHLEMLETALGRPSLRARVATDEDPTSDVLILGVDFEYLKIEDDGLLTTHTEVGPANPARIVVDADSYLAGAVDRANPPTDGTGQWSVLAISRTAILQVPTAGPKPGWKPGTHTSS